MDNPGTNSFDNCGGCDFGHVIKIGNEGCGPWTGLHRHSAIYVVSTYNFQCCRIILSPSYFFGSVDRGLNDFKEEQKIRF